MRFVIVSVALMSLCLPATAQYSYVQIDQPDEGILVLLHPTQPAKFQIQGSTHDGVFEVRVGHSDLDPWGMCYFVEPMLDAEAIYVAAWSNPPDTFVLLDTPMALDALPDTDGWTVIDLTQMRGGGFTEEAVEFIAAVEGFGGCPFETKFEYTLRSADINGDLAVDLSDITLFTQGLADYTFYADLNDDGVVNLSDITLMAMGIRDQ